MADQAPYMDVGIDPGAKTGFALWDAQSRDFAVISTKTMITAQREILEWQRINGLRLVVFEDARLRKGGFERADAAQAKHGAGIREGVGSVKAECRLWQEFCEVYGIPFKAVAPAKATTKLTAAEFKALTGWKPVTSAHGRDAAMLVHNAAHASRLLLPGTCAVCGHRGFEHLATGGNCPAGQKTRVGFTRYAATKYTETA